MNNQPHLVSMHGSNTITMDRLLTDPVLTLFPAGLHNRQNIKKNGPTSAISATGPEGFLFFQLLTVPRYTRFPCHEKCYWMTKAIGDTPMIQIAVWYDGATVFAKCEFFQPLNSWDIAAAMIEAGDVMATSMPTPM